VSLKQLQTRARLLEAVRAFFKADGFLEVETPMRIPTPIPEAYIDVEPAGDWVLHPSPEICMKRLLADGFDKIYQICRCFRQGERGLRHLPEFTLLEWYQKGADYNTLMVQCENMIAAIAHELKGGCALSVQGHHIDLSPPWRRLSVKDAFDAYGACSLAEALTLDRFDEIIGMQIEPLLGWSKPVFLCDYPHSQASMARLKPSNPSVAERFELYIAGLELCNGFSELTDANEQKRRFIAELDARQAAAKASYPLPLKFLQALQQLPPCAGNAMGIDRLVMLFGDAARIDDVVCFTPEDL
jgi:lysyl-tRNA synthetase class 2